MKITLDFSGKTRGKDALRARGAFEGQPVPKTLKRFAGKEGETFVERGTLWVGLGKKQKHTLEKVRRAAAKALSQAKAQQAASLILETGSLSGPFGASETASAAVEGLRLSDYRFDKYKSKPSPKPALASVTLAFESARDASLVRKAFRETEIVCEAVVFARDLANEPANVMTPPALAQAAKDMAKKSGLACRVLGRTEMKKLGMGGILAVSQGSSFEPQLIVLENKGRGKPVVLVGKGVTFDTGGISIKPSGDMDKMKFDM